MTNLSPTDVAALDAARRGLDFLNFNVARYEITTWRCRDAARAYLAAGFPIDRLGPYFELAWQRGLHDRVHSYEALPDEYVGNNADLVADAYLAGGDSGERLTTLIEVLDAVVKQKGNTLSHRVQLGIVLWAAGGHDGRVRRLLSPVRTANDAARQELDLHEHRARFALAVVEGDRAEATRWLETYDAAVQVQSDTGYPRIHLITLAFWLIARDRYAMTLPTTNIAGLPPAVCDETPTAIAAH